MQENADYEDCDFESARRVPRLLTFEACSCCLFATAAVEVVGRYPDGCEASLLDNGLPCTSEIEFISSMYLSLAYTAL